MPSPIDAIEVAALVRNMKSITEAAALIDQYAATVASAAKLQATSETFDRAIRIIDGTQLSRKGHKNG